MSKFTEKLREEFVALLPPTLFFFVALNLIALIRVLMLKGTGIPVSTWIQVAVGALVLGKAVLIVNYCVIHELALQLGPRKLRAIFFGAPEGAPA
jgi:hypothetical protein